VFHPWLLPFGFRISPVVSVIALAPLVGDYGDRAGCSSGMAFHLAPTEKFHLGDSSYLTRKDDIQI
jgi:hypothetical protein